MRRIAIGCQGGGSHTAFTAGALRTIIADSGRGRDFEIVALSGTSGGAIDATLAWYGLLLDGGPAALDRLDRFWQQGFPTGGAATLPADRLANAAAVAALRLPFATASSPYLVDQVLQFVPAPVRRPLQVWLDAQTGLRTIVEAFVDFSRIPALVAENGGRLELLIGAAEVLSGDFRVFQGTDPAFGVEAVVASGTLPEIARATRIERGTYAGVYWDGLYSENPPIAEFFDVATPPDEIWIIRINPQRRASEPMDLSDIVDRRNELAGNQSLAQELRMTRFINRLAGDLAETRAALAALGPEVQAAFEASPLARDLDRYRRVDLPEPLAISPAVAERLDYASKFRRDPEFLSMLQQDGIRQATAFLDGWRQGRAGTSAGQGG